MVIWNVLKQNKYNDNNISDNHIAAALREDTWGGGGIPGEITDHDSKIVSFIQPCKHKYLTPRWVSPREHDGGGASSQHRGRAQDLPSPHPCTEFYF